MKKSKVTQPHDKLIKKLLSNPAAAKDILSLYLPQEVSALVDLNNLVLQRDSFIDDEHRAFAVDLLYKTTFSKEEGYIWILIEHQRKDDPWLPVRIFQYIAIIWDHIRRTSKKYKIPLVYPLIIYNGDQPYTNTLNLRDMIEPESSRVLFDQLFQKPFQLVDLAAIKDQQLREHMQDHIRGIALLMTLKHVFNRNLQDFFEQILVEVYKKLDQAGDRDSVADLLYYLLNEGEFLQEGQFWTILHQEFSPEIEGKVMTIIQKIEIRNLEKGIEQEKQVIAERLLAEKAEFSFIEKITGLSLAQIEQIKKKSH